MDQAQATHRAQALLAARKPLLFLLGLGFIALALPHTLPGQERAGSNQIRYANEFKGADATAQIMAAIADIKGGGTVDARRIRGGRFSGTIRVDKPIHLMLGSGTYRHSGSGPIVELTAAGSSLECVSPTSTIVVTSTSTADGVVLGSGTAVRNCTLRGTNIPARGYSGIDSGNASNVAIVGNTIEKWGDAGINTGGSSHHWKIFKNLVQLNKQQGIFIGADSDDAEISGNTVLSNDSIGIDINASRAFISNNTVRSNGVSSTEGFGILVAAVSSSISGVSVIGNIVTGQKGPGILVTAGADLTSSFIDITENRITSQAAANGDGILIGDGSAPGIYSNIRIQKNAVRGNARYGIALDATSVAAMSSVTIVDNEIIGNRSTGLFIGSGVTDTVTGLNTILSNGKQFIDNGTRTIKQ